MMAATYRAGMTMDPLTLSLVSACTALVASIVGPLVTLAVARRQFNANVLSANRQKWIESLRDMLAELISLLVAALVIKSQWQDKWDRGRGAFKAEPGLIDKLQRIVLAQAKINLLLNPTDTDHQKLSHTIETAFKRLQSDASSDHDTQADILLITEVGQTILRREWQRVKQGI